MHSSSSSSSYPVISFSACQAPHFSISQQDLGLTYCTLPALPTCNISPVALSSLRNTGQELPSAFASVTSSLVPRILNEDFSGSMGPHRDTNFLYRLGFGVSVVGRSRSSF